MKIIYERIIENLNNNIPCALATVVHTTGSTPRKSGAKMVVCADEIIGTVGGGEIESKIIDMAKDAIQENSDRLVEFEIDEGHGTGICGGTVEIFIEPLLPSPKLYIFGAGHVGSIVAKMAANLDFDITIVDDREELVCPDNFSPKIHTISGDFIDIINRLPFDETTYIVIVTRGHEFDYEVLKECINKPYRYIGMMGSEKKVAATFNKLNENGISREKLSSVNAPIGVEIQSETPAEIAISILGQVIAFRRS